MEMADPGSRTVVPRKVARVGGIATEEAGDE
jgi:hypothetical protein